MKYLPIITSTIPSKDGEGRLSLLTTTDFVKAALNHQPQGGYKAGDLRDRFRVLDAIDKANGCLALEDADAKTLQRCVNETTWTVLHRDVLAFCDAVANMADTPPTEASAPSEA